MAASVCRAFTRPKLVNGIEWEMYYTILLFCMFVAWMALWSHWRLLLLPLAYFGPYTLFRWAGRRDPQWSLVYPKARRNRRVFLAGGDTSDEQPWPKRVLPKLPRFNP
jgi:hypothetical protein